MRMIVLISSLLVSTAAWAQDGTQEVSVRQVQLPPISETTVIAVPLDTAVYETAATNLHDLRLLDRHPTARRVVFERGSSIATMRALPIRARNAANVTAMAVGWWAKSSYNV